MINEPDVTGKTPVDYATEGKTPRCCIYCRDGSGIDTCMCPEEKFVLTREHSVSSAPE